MTRNPPNPQRGPSSSHAGVTISEVLISMVIMAIGVVSLATLFPASVLRSIQASQLTNSALLSKNAKARLTYDTSLLSNRVVLIPNIQSLNPVNPPTTAMIDPFGTVIDSSTNQSRYNLPTTMGGQQGGGVKRVAGNTSGVSNQQFAEGLAMLPDSWSLVRQDSIIGGYTSGSHQLALASSADNFTDIIPRTLSAAGSTNPLYRMVVLDATGRYAFRRTIRQVLNGNQLSWADPNGSYENDLPANFMPARCRVEVRDNRYTWMLTVRKRPLTSDLISWKAEADLVVFFNRSFKVADEVLITTIQPTPSGSGGFDRQPGLAGVDDNLDGRLDNFTTNTISGEDDWPGSDDLRTVSYTGSLPPYLKKGSYLLETSQARWYRVVNINTNNSLILLDHDLIDLPTNGSVNFVAIKGITQVFELGSFSGSQ